ncbi:hypothetical protein [Rhodococcus rhodochrous]|uniref:Uncharacterized protein n=1 Tax=Rhodococcus rhodochrous KG-21 TaxID=1441923 RepID=A0A0M9WQW5_RHORH|nr:hypothetical protein [Rhodococcus rhodochrous]KOS58197.1 hypothetical protein Z051_01160 [Rhodococcus rhodochrous KG-21]
MRPLPSEIIAGVRRILKESIEPELASGHARAKLREVRAVLAQVDWDDAGFVLSARNRSLTDALREIESWRVEDSVRSAMLPESAVVPPAADCLAAHQACYEQLAASAVALVEPLSDWIAAHPEDARAVRLNRDLLAAL